MERTIVLDFTTHESAYTVRFDDYDLTIYQVNLRPDTLLTISHNLYRKKWAMRYETTRDATGSDRITRIILTKGK